MKLTIDTTRLQELITRAVRGAGNNKNIPMTEYIAMEVKDGTFKVTTTDAENFLYLTAELEGAEDFYVAVSTDTFVKLISKMTCEKVTLEITDNYLLVKGNGEYKIDIPLDEDGGVVRLPDPIGDISEYAKLGTVNDTTVATILNSVKPSLLTTMDYPWFTAYYVGDSVVGTDTYMISSYAKSVLPENPKLISAKVMDLLGLLVGDIDIYAKDNKLVFVSTVGTVYGVQPDGIENYTIDAIKGMVSQRFTYSCKVAKAPILNLLDRISLFVGAFDNGEIVLNFMEDGLEVSSKYANETIVYTEAVNAEDFTCRTDIKTLVTQIKAQLGDVVEIEYGDENAIKLIDGDVTSVVALIGE